MDTAVDPSTVPHDNKASILIGVVCFVMVIATVAVGLRFYTRAIIIKQLGADDYLTLIALILAYATGITQCAHTRDGLGAHMWDLEGPQQLVDYFRTFYISIVFYNAGLLFVKIAFLMQYYRVLAIKKMQTICVVTMVIVGCWSSSQVLVGIFICSPIAGFWDHSLPAKCIPNLPQWYINAAGNIATDIAIFVLPLPVLGHLNLPKTQRLILIGIFSLGFFTCAISVIRIRYLDFGGDTTYNNVEASIWSTTEVCSGITCLCLPTLRPLISKWVPSLRTRLQKSTKGHGRRSGSDGTYKGTDIEMGNKPSRGDSKRVNNLGLGSMNGLYYPDGYEMRGSESADNKSGMVGFKRMKEDTLSDESTATSPISPTSPLPAYVTSHSSRSRLINDDWIRPGVTTKISGGRTPQPDSTENRYSINVKRDVLMHK